MLIATLIAYLIALLAIGWWASRQTVDHADFHLAGRRLGPVVAALSASASSSSAWTLLGMSGAAYAWGLQAVWLVPAVMSGFLINWILIAPRLQARAHANGTLTLVEFLAHGAEAGAARRLRTLGALIILFCFAFYVAAQFQAAGVAIGNALDVPGTLALLLGALIVVLYVFLGGFWAASVTDALQGLMMLFVALVMPVAAMLAAGGPAAIADALMHGADPALARLVDQPSLPMALLFIAGLFGIGLGYPGQPHVVNRFMALQHAGSVGRARAVALIWAALIYTGMLVLGWAARALLPELADPESALLVLAETLLPPVLAGLVTGGVLAAVMSTADSQLLVAGGAVSHDLRRSGPSLTLDRLVVAALGALSVVIALFFPATIFERVLFAWQGLGNAFGPLLIVLLCFGPVRSRWRVAAVLTGFGLTVALSLLPNTPGDAAERLLPFFLSLAIAIAGRERVHADAPAQARG
ncbi:MAG: sodium/proline symporter PutP [Wenzhouxiangellaceae bacterium]